MRRFIIAEIEKTSGARTHRYAVTRERNGYTGTYVCNSVAVEERTKKLLDFICMPNTKISRVIDEVRRANLTEEQRTFRLEENTQQGVITRFKPNDNTMMVYFNNSLINGISIERVTKRVVALPVTAAVTDNTVQVGPSRSTISQETNAELVALEAQILKVRDIRLEKTLKKSIPTDLQSFLIKFFKTYNEEKDTIYTDDKTVQTTSGRRRSLGDIFKICKYYFPNCTLREVLVLLYRTLPTVIRDGFRTSYCTTIRKRVWYYDEGEDNGVFNQDQNDEYVHTVRWYTDKIR